MGLSMFYPFMTAIGLGRFNQNPATEKGNRYLNIREIKSKMMSSVGIRMR